MDGNGKSLFAFHCWIKTLRKIIFDLLRSGFTLIVNLIAWTLSSLYQFHKVKIIWNTIMFANMFYIKVNLHNSLYLVHKVCLSKCIHVSNCVIQIFVLSLFMQSTSLRFINGIVNNSSNRSLIFRKYSLHSIFMLLN